MNLTRLSSLNSASTVDLFLTSLGIPKAHIKKFSLKKAFRNKEVRPKDTLCLPLDLPNRLMINPVYNGPPINILHDDNNFLVLDKPPNIHGHPLRYSDKQNCLSFLRSTNHFAPLNVAPSKHERGMLFRLDNTTSGVLFFAKKECVYRQVRPVEKIYHAVTTKPVKRQGEITLNFTPSEKRGKHIAASEDGPGKVGTLQLKTVASKGDFHMHQIILKTGLRHQIRSLLTFLDAPILGDREYGGKRAERLFLHAHKYSLEYAGTIICVSSPTPHKFRDLLLLEP